MKVFMLLATSLVAAALSACDTGQPPGAAAGPAEAPLSLEPGSSAQSDPEVLVESSLLCQPLPVNEMAAGGGRAFQAGGFWLFDLRFSPGDGAAAGPGTAAVPCHVYDLRTLYSQVYSCLAGGSCGKPFEASKLEPMMKPIEAGLSDVAMMGGVPVEVFTTSTRMRILLDRTSDPLAVLAHLDPKIQSLSGHPDGEVSTGAEPAGQEPDQRVAGGCCGGLCTPCMQGQCEPRPGVIVRGLSAIRYECACEAVCAATDLPEDCPCRDSCAENNLCPDKP